MCGRFVGFRSLEELRRHFPIDRACCEVSANFNVAPTQAVLAIVRRDGRNELDRFHWGLVPSWAKDTTMGARLINARAETVAEKPSFRSAFKRRRCLILADGFYEWAGAKGRRQPVLLTLPDGEPFAFAGLWETWQNPAADHPPYRSCSIITTAASDSVRPVHHRMPAILRAEHHGLWLDPDNRDTKALALVLQTGLHETLASRPVSSRVNRPENNDPRNIAPLTQLPLTFR